MTESSIGEIIGIDKRYDAVCISIQLLPEEMKDPEEMFEHRIGDKVIINECSKRCSEGAHREVA